MRNVLFTLRKKSFVFAIMLMAFTYAGRAQYYVQSPCDFAPLATAGTNICLADDAVSGAIPLGFSFSFYGSIFTDCYVGSNGFLSFSPGMGSGCCTGQILPSAAFPYTIFFGQEDLDPNSCVDGTISYYTTGTPGNQIFVLSFTDVPHYPGPVGVFPVTNQVQLYEATGDIKIVTTQYNSDGGSSTMGLNQDGVTADIVPGRNSTNWSASNECILFSVFEPVAFDGGVTDVTNPVSGLTLGAENITITIQNYGFSAISEFPVNYSVDGGPTVTETYTGSIAPFTSGSFTFATTHDFSADGCYSILAWTSVGDDGDNGNDDYTESVCNLGPITGTGQWYIYSNVFGGAEPWFTTANTDAMNQAFGPEGTAWTRGYFETIDPAAVFNSDNCFVWLEGSDFCAIELEDFLTANIGLIEGWVSSGGKLFLNAAPNEGDGMSYGFGGTTLTYPYYTGSATAVDALHPIFNGPWTPAGTDYTGTSFAHAIVSGTGLTSLMQDLFAPGNVCLTEKTWGDGRVVFGGMTTTNFHSPAPNALNLRANILAYLGCNLVATCEIPSGLSADGITTNDANLHWTAVDGADQYRVTIQNTATGLIKTKGFPTNEVIITDKLTPLTTYAFRVKTVCYDDLGVISAPSPWYYFTTLGRIGDTDGSVTLFPNPNNGSFTLELNGLTASTFNVTVFDAVGHMVYSKVVTADNGNYSENISLDVPAGMYQVNIMNGISNMTYPIVIQK